MKDILILMLVIAALSMIGAVVGEKKHPKPDTYTNKPCGEYQLRLDNDSVWLWDGRRYVGAVPWIGCKLDSLILNDNNR